MKSNIFSYKFRLKNGLNNLSILRSPDAKFSNKRQGGCPLQTRKNYIHLTKKGLNLGIFIVHQL